MFDKYKIMFTNKYIQNKIYNINKIIVYNNFKHKLSNIKI